MTKKTFYSCQEGPLFSLAINKSANYISVVGRNIFKIFHIKDDEQCFVEALNLRVGKNIPNYSANDVAWNHLDDSILATAATNGRVVTWNLNSTSRDKLDKVYGEHGRTVNRVCFHPNEVHLLLSGSQGGVMKLFDLRRKEVVKTFESSPESVRDVQFSPFRDNIFASVQENGDVQLWDLRIPDKCERSFPAHNGPVLSCDWHPSENKCIATGGRDKTLKIWDISKEPTTEHCIQTIAPVAKVKWRPTRSLNIASSSLTSDFTIYVWDFERPYVPFAAFIEHSDVVTSFVWRDDPHVLISVGKDGMLYQHIFKDADRPANHANNHGLDLNNHGDVCFAISDYFLKNVSNGTSTNHPYVYYTISSDKKGFFKKPSDHIEQFKCSSSSLRLYVNQNALKCISMDWFVVSAIRNKLSGKTLSELCDHNADVATHLGRLQVAQAWHIVKYLYCNAKNGTYEEKIDTDGKTRKVESKTVRISSMTSINSLAAANKNYPDNSMQNAIDSDSSDGIDGPIIYDNRVNQSNFLSADEEQKTTSFSIAFEMSPENAALVSSDHHVPSDTFHDMNDLDDCLIMNSFNEPVHYSLMDESSDESKSIDSERCQSVVSSAPIPPIATWKFNDIVIEMLHFYANQGDVQMTVSVIAVLGDRLKNLIDDVTQEFWFHSYIELLSRHQLWNVVNQIIRLSSIASVNSINQTSTTVYVGCGSCNKSLNGKVTWLCEKCKTSPAQCSICHRIVKGAYVWCQGCSHGGHLRHIEEWLKISRSCPTGCGHQCEFM